MSTAAPSPYELLELAPGADAAAVRDAFKRLALQVCTLLFPLQQQQQQQHCSLVLQLHPDKGGDAAAFAALKNAFETLSDSTKLQAWEQGQGQGQGQGFECVDIDAMAYHAARGCFTLACRCSGEFVASEDLLDRG
jgi:DnaJ-class molecular chaperone